MDYFNAKEFARDLISHRILENDMTLKELSIKTGISSATLSRIERKKAPDVNTFCHLCIYMMVKPEKYFNTQP